MFALSSNNNNKNNKNNISIASIDYSSFFYCVWLLCTESLWFLVVVSLVFFGGVFVSFWPAVIYPVLLCLVDYCCFSSIWVLLLFLEMMISPEICFIPAIRCPILPTGISVSHLYKNGIVSFLYAISTHLHMQLVRVVAILCCWCVHTQSRQKFWLMPHDTKKKTKNNWYEDSYGMQSIRFLLRLMWKLKGTKLYCSREILIEYDGNHSTKYD